MITLRVWFLVTATILLIAVGIWTPLVNPVRADRHAVASPAVAARTAAGEKMGRVSSLGFDSEALQELLESAQPHVDIYGNEIEDAITDYRIDSAGDVYERHSPETEVPRLGPPIS